ncbi:MAG: UvrB/UvrC motif-containing protein [Phycisphaerales bacterium]
MQQTETIFENCFLVESNMQDLPSSAGLVFFTSKDDLPIALLTSANIRRTVKTKLAEQQEKSKRADLKSITAKIYYTVYACKFRLAVNLYTAARKIFGDKYKDYVTLVHPWYLTINLNDRIPFFYATRKPAFKESEKIIGPFSSQRSAALFQTMLEDGFNLCRNSEFANSSEHSKSCPYLQMDSCCGVCAGKISVETYKQILDEAFAAADNPDKAIELYQLEMQKAAKELNFERAAGLKKRIEKLSSLKKPAFKWTGDLRKLKIVHVDKSLKIKLEGSKAKKQSYAVFTMNAFGVIDAGDFLWDNPDIIKEVIRKNIELLPNTPDSESLERFAIVTYFLYRSKPPGLWVNAENIDNLEGIKL